MFGDLSIDKISCIVIFKGNEIIFIFYEFELLWLFVLNVGEVLSCEYVY